MYCSMTKLKPGDRVDCCVKEDAIVNPYEDDFDGIKTFEILSSDAFGYFVFVPQYFSIKNSYKLDQYTCKNLNILPKFIGENILYIKEGLVYKINARLDGTKCAKCHDFVNMAEPNQQNGTLICWSCLAYPYH